MAGIRSSQIRDGEVKRSDLNTTTSGEAVVRKLIQGEGISLSSDGVDAGTGDVTISADGLVKLSGDQTIAGVKTFSSIPVGPASSPTTDNQLARKKYVDDSVVAVERALVMGKSGTIPASATDAADFLIVVPFNMTLYRMKGSRTTHGSAATTVQIRRSTNGGASFSDVFGYLEFTSTGLTSVWNPADLAVNEDDVLNFTIASGGGTNLLVEIIGVAR